MPSRPMRGTLRFRMDQHMERIYYIGKLHLLHRYLFLHKALGMLKTSLALLTKLLWGDPMVILKSAAIEKSFEEIQSLFRTKYVMTETQFMETVDLQTVHPSRLSGSAQVLAIWKRAFVASEPLVTYLTSHLVNELKNQLLST